MNSVHQQAKRNLLLWTLIAAAVGLGIGMIIGRFGFCTEDGNQNVSGIPESLVQDGDPTISPEIISQIRSENIRQYLRELSEYPHLAGTDADYKQAKELHDFWKSVGLDEAFITPYDVLLSYPETEDESKMNRIFVYNSTNQIVWESALYEPILDPSENKSNVVPPFNAYSAPGDISSMELVYVNYGRVEDYRWLANSTNINVTGKIVLARYGKIFRGDKVNQAYLHGAIGIIIYSDPADYAVDGENSQVYPHDWWLPDTGTQRGTIFLGQGDPLTPGYPATENAYRLNESDSEAELPKIPSHPIGYGVAKTLIGYMSGAEVPQSWKGALNITYKYGGQLGNSGWRIRIRISTKNSKRRTYNVFGIIRGRIEPDRYVLLGNHRDAWVFGAIDPSSGTAVMKEVSRVMGNLARTNRWRPRRTIVFCSWGAEEYGLIGSTEWIEQYVKNLGSRAVAYLNVDIAVQGNYSLRSLGTPLLNSVIYDATKKVPNPDEQELAMKTVYDKWLSSFPDTDNKLPRISNMGSGSDYAPFIQRVGLPCLDIRYTFDSNKYKISSYPLYHSKYETFKVVDEIMDRGFKRHRAVGQTWAELARNLADSLIIPFKVEDYAHKLQSLVKQLDSDFGALMRKNGIQLDLLYNASSLFTSETTAFQKSVDSVNKKDPFAIRKINDQLIQLERAFIDPQGLPGRPLARHVLFAESSVNTYAGSSFPGLADGMFEIEGSPDEQRRWEIVKKHFTVILYTIESAASTLREASRFMPL
ncbi:N-acetylated-alpha-linked acidic dipeptidase 2-like [Saccostrea echinata]|uniref:N-acetylated-alpha-linked acidic dipeptidase 2-like n=1 Tax=Saccostrea echinata TaxID=191078 RepID=UPI002A7EB83F|nr:N-acetylated-alpha-linked acidic dipeptidase 2-like [Saccostrea echinata]